MSDQAAQPDPKAEPEQAEPSTTEPSGPPEWLGPITQRMDELRDQQLSVVDQLRQMQPSDEDEEIAIEDLYGDDGELTPEAAQALVDQAVDARLDARMGARDATDARARAEHAYNALLDEIPALQDPKVVEPLVRDLADDLRDAGLDAVLDSPAFVDWLEDRYKAQLYDERVKAETAAQPQRPVVLESAQGAAPQQNDETDWGERIVKAAERLRPKI